MWFVNNVENDLFHKSELSSQKQDILQSFEKNNELMLIKLKKYFEDNRNDNILYT